MAEIFVFGSNLAGRHGKGAALFARQKYGAEYGVGEGRTGNAYAIPTKDAHLQTLSLCSIKEGIYEFLDYAWNSNDTFIVTPVGTGLAGIDKEKILAIFKAYEEDVSALPNNLRFTWSWFQ